MGSKLYRAKVGPPELFDVIGAHQFCVMIRMGLREHHKMLDLGCGCLRGGKFFINYLKPRGYVGIDPDIDLVWEGVRNELTESVFRNKSPILNYWDDFVFAERLGKEFDFVLAQSILTHTGHDLAKSIMQEAFDALKPGGKFVATYFDGVADSNLTGWLGNDIASYTTPFMRKALTDIGFVGVARRGLGHPVGQTWIEATVP